MKQEPIRDEFLEKRKARQRKARKKRAITTFIFLMVCLVITAVILCLTIFFPIKNITAMGSKIYSNDEIVKQSGISVGDNIFTFGEKRTTLNIKSKLPFIESIKYERKLPDKLVIKVTDAKAYYCYKQGDSYFNVSKNGWVLEKASEKPNTAFEIILGGVKAEVGKPIEFSDPNQTEILNNLISLLEENDLKIDYVDVADTVSLKVGVDGRFDVELGTQNDIENKMKQLKTMVNEMQNGEKGLIRLYMWNPQKPDGTFVENYTK